MHPRIRKLMTMYKALHPRDDIDEICQGKNEEEDSPAIKVWFLCFNGISTLFRLFNAKAILLEEH